MSTTRLSFAEGIAAPFAAWAFLAKRPRLWPLALVPAAVAMVLFGGLGYGAIRLAFFLAHAWIGAAPTGAWVVAYALVLVLLVASGLLLAVFVALTLAQPLSSAALDAIARRVEVAQGGTSWPESSTWESISRSIRVTTLALLVGLPIFVVLTLLGLFVPGAALVTVPLKFLVSALLLAWDLFDYAFGLRGWGVKKRLAWMRAHFAAVLAFGLCAGAFMLIPAIGLFVLPVGVAGASRLLVNADQRISARLPSKEPTAGALKPPST